MNISFPYAEIKPLDIPDAKTIVDMVNAGIISVETAQEMLGLDKAKEQANMAKAEITDVNQIYSQSLSRVNHGQE